uniref:Uncharacterized protein n=1 Tax=Arundo donax TaxID=35708 RepID=A0A0A9H3N4_ARUDO
MDRTLEVAAVLAVAVALLEVAISGVVVERRRCGRHRQLFLLALTGS